VISIAAARIAASPRGRAALLAAAPLAALLLAFAPGDLAPAAARAALVAAALGAGALLARRRNRTSAPAAMPLTVVGRESLAAGAGVAVVEVAGRRLLVGFGRDGVRLVLDLGAPPERARP
jgi:flagellar protein FliO/FliZ